jgi:hypothetical protein
MLIGTPNLFRDVALLNAASGGPFIRGVAGQDSLSAEIALEDVNERGMNYGGGVRFRPSSTLAGIALNKYSFDHLVSFVRYMFAASSHLRRNGGHH